MLLLSSFYFRNFLTKINLHQLCKLSFLMVCIFFAPSFALAQTPDAGTIINNIITQVPSLMALVTASAFIMGIFMIIVAIMKFKHIGELRTMMSHEHSVMEPLVIITVGSLLVYIPSTIWTGLNTFFADANPYAYQPTSDTYSQAIQAVIIVLQLFGTIALIRGLVILSHLGGRGGHGDGGLGKGLTHIIGGLFCVNIYEFVQIINNTLGV